MEGKSDYNIKNKITQIILFIISISLISILAYIIYYTISAVSPNYAFYFLSTLVQIEATILAILISLGVVAIQLTATSYSSRVTRIYQRNKWFIFIIVVLVFIIILTLTFLKISDSSNQINLILRISYLFGIGYIVIIPFYIDGVYRILQPSNIIKKISEEITLKKILRNDSKCILTMIDFLKGSFKRHDYKSIKEGLKNTDIKLKTAIEKANNHQLYCITIKIFKELEDYCKFSLMHGDDEIILGALDISEKTAQYIMDKEIDVIGKKTVSSLYLITNFAIKKGNEEAISQLSSFLRILGKNSLEKNLFETFNEIIKNYKNIWEYTREKKIINLSIDAISNISSLAKFAVETQNFDQLNEVNLWLKKIAISSIENNYEEDLNEIISAYENILIKTFWGIGIWIL